MSDINNNRIINIGFIGLGGRGRGLLKLMLDMDDIRITAVCDRVEDRLAMGLEACRAKYGSGTVAATDYMEVISMNDIEAVVIPTSWNDHYKVAAAAMEKGKYAAFEVGPAQSEAECAKLVRVYEQTGVPCMLLENCCYGREEMTLLNMIRKGLLGELIHCGGGYEHDLRILATTIDSENIKERSWHYIHRNGDLYPTHALGPIMKYLDINRGNRMLSLVSMSTKSRGMHEYILKKYGAGSPLASIDFSLGDIVTTLIKCSRGETIVLTHDTTLPRPYSRGGRVQGTAGLWMEDNRSIHIEGRSPAEKWEPFENYYNEFEHPLWKQYRAQKIKAGHGGMDYLVLRSFLESVRNRTSPPFDVYDSVSAMAISYLSEQSISMGSMPVAIPDFTSGRWIKREPALPSIFSLDAVYDGMFEKEITI